MFPVLSPSTGGLGGLGVIGGRGAVLGATLGPGVGSMRCDLVGAGPWATFRVGDSDVQTASILAVPGMATELQIRWGRQVSVDDSVLENVPGAQGAHTTSDVAVPGLVTPKPGMHLRSAMHSRHPSCLPRVQYQPGLQEQMRFCFGVQA